MSGIKDNKKSNVFEIVSSVLVNNAPDRRSVFFELLKKKLEAAVNA